MASIADIQGVRVSGGYYSEPTDFMFFDDQSHGRGGVRNRASVVYGANGSGKTSLSRIVAKCDDGALQDGSLAFLDGDGNEIADSLPLDSIHVFNEEYLRTKMLVEQRGLGSIVMLGEQVDINDQLESTERELEEKKEKQEEARASYEAAHAASAPNGPLERAAKESVKDGGWRDRYSSIDGGPHNLVSSAWTIIVQSRTTRSRVDLEREFESSLARYGAVRDLTKTIDGRMSDLVPTVPDEGELVALLEKTVERPVLSERERLLMTLVDQGHGQTLEFARGRFRDASTTRCPVCLQRLTPEYRESIVESIERILSDDVDAYRESLERVTFVIPEIDEGLLSHVNDDLKSSIMSCRFRLQTIVADYKGLIGARYRNPYERLDVEPLGLAACVVDLSNLLKSADEEIEALNDAVRNALELKNALVRLNNQIAWIDCCSQLEELEEKRKQATSLKASLQSLNDTVTRLEKDRNDLIEKQRNTGIAVELINKYLATVFFDKKRMSLASNDGMYEIKCNGHPVLPTMISEGERHVLGLCYFFASIGEDKLSAEVDSKPHFILLDDPISSVDSENRVGIQSLLHSRAYHLLKGNEETSVVVLTHHLGVAFDLRTCMEQVEDSLKGEGIVFGIIALTLEGGRLGRLPRQKAIYPELLRRTYCYAKGESDDNEAFVIGNIMRRLLEAYVRFNYNLDFDKLATDSDLAEKLEPLSDIFRNMTYRLALHNESHFTEVILSLDRQRVFEGFSDEEKQTIARRLLVLLNKLDPIHIKKLVLGMDHVGYGAMQRDLTTWEQELTAG